MSDFLKSARASNVDLEVSGKFLGIVKGTPLVKAAASDAFRADGLVRLGEGLPGLSCGPAEQSETGARDVHASRGRTFRGLTLSSLKRDFLPSVTRIYNFSRKCESCAI